MSVPTRSRRAATARLTRWLVVLAASSAVLAIAVLGRLPEGEGSRVVSPLPPFEEPAAAPRPPVEPIPRSASAPELVPPAHGRALSPLDDLRTRSLTLPVEGTRPEQLVASFGERRGERSHEAIDILAPIGTPVVAVESGRIQKLFDSERGGLTIYHFDPQRRYAYYYAHLARYADGLHEGQDVVRGAVIGYVGTTGNAPPHTPHLHFAIFELGPERQWWKGAPIDPYLVWRPKHE